MLNYSIVCILILFIGLYGSKGGGICDRDNLSHRVSIISGIFVILCSVILTLIIVFQRV